MSCFGVIRIWDWSQKALLVVDDNDDRLLVVLWGWGYQSEGPFQRGHDFSIWNPNFLFQIFC